MCVVLAISVAFDDFAGSSITTAVLAHLALSTASKFRLTTADFASEWKVKGVDDSLVRSNGSVAVSNHHCGLGLVVNREQLGEPLFTIS